MRNRTTRHQEKRKTTKKLALALLILVVEVITILNTATVNPTPAQTTPSAPPPNSNNHRNLSREASSTAAGTDYWAKTYGGSGHDVAFSVLQCSCEYIFAIMTNATNFAVTACKMPPSGTSAPPSGLLSYIYLNMTGDIPPGSNTVFISIYFNATKAQQLFGMNDQTLQLYRWNATTSEWQAILSTIAILNSTHGLIAANLNHFSNFAVFGEQPMPVPSTTTTSGGGGTTSTDTGVREGVSVLIVLGVVIAVMAVILAAILVMRRRQSVAKVG